MAISQNISIQGFVHDKVSDLPLTGANVYILASKKGEVTDEDGWFSLTLSPEDIQDTLVVSFLGYQDRKIAISTFENGSTIHLESKSLEFGDEIEVSAERINLIKQDIPHARRTFDFEEIREYGGAELSDVLKTVPAIHIEGNDLDGHKIQIRGSDPDEVNVYVDGVLINSARFDNSADISIVPLESIENLEVLKGGNLAFLGMGAFGGIVNITTRQPSELSFYVKGKFGSFDSQYLLAEIDVPFHPKLSLNYYLQISQWKPGIKFYPTERFEEKTKSEESTTSKNNHYVNLNYSTRKGQISAKFMGYFQNYKEPQLDLDYNNYLNVVSYKGEIFGQKDFEFNLNHLYKDDEINRNPAGSTEFINSYLSNQLNARLSKKINYQALEFQLLTEYFHEDLKSVSTIQDVNRNENIYDSFIYDNRFSIAGVISAEDYVPDKRNITWKTFLGTRGDFLASGPNDWSMMLGAEMSYRLENSTFYPYFNWGQNVKYPSLEESAFTRDILDFTREDSTSDRLKPEYNTSADLGIRSKYFPQNAIYQNMEVTFSLFTRTTFNKLVKDPITNIIVVNTQLGRNITRGVEGSLSFNGIYRYLSLLASFMYLDISDPLLYSFKPEQKYSLNLRFNPGWFYLTITPFYEGKSVGWKYDSIAKPGDDIQIINIDPFYDLDFSIGTRIKLKNSEIDLQFSGNNIFDNYGFTYYYLKKKYLQVSLAFRF
jgi:hypothetical protein